MQHHRRKVVKLIDEKGKPLSPNKHIKQKMDVKFLISWQNIITIKYYPNRLDYDFHIEKGSRLDLD